MPTKEDPIIAAGHNFREIKLNSSRGTLAALTRTGNGDPIVVVHGVLADAVAWKRVVEHVAPDRPALIVNRRGRTPSVGLDENYSVEVEVDDLLHWLGTLDVPVDLIGHSFGGLIACEAVRRGARVRSLVLYEPVMRPFGPELIEPLTTAIESGDLELAVEIVNVDLSGYSRADVAAMRSGPAWKRLCELAEPAAAELRAIDHFDFTAPELSNVPTTMIAGELSRHRPPYGPNVDAYLDALAFDSVEILDGEDHIAHVTAPVELAHVIETAVTSTA